MRFAACLLLLCLIVVLPSEIRAQAPAAPAPGPAPVLIADTIDITADRALIARGNVEVVQGDTRLTARAITYDPEADGLSIEGPITLTDGSGLVVVADAAELSPDLRNGLLRSARVVLYEQVQLASVQMNRVDGRYAQLYKTAVTSCKVCSSGQAPLWQIRARRIVHDQQERQLYFDGAQFLIRNVPVFYMPYLRLPDPSLDRATGFLIPSVRTTSQLGNGVKIPYFFRLGDHRDLTLTPYISPETRTLEFRYRQAFRTGRITFTGAASRDSLRSGSQRWYLFSVGQFGLRRGYSLTFDLKMTSDDAYLKQYDYSQQDRLTSTVTLSRTRRNSFTEAQIINITSLRAGEADATLPTQIVDLRHERRLFPARLGGELRLSLASHAHYRSSDSIVPGEGRDVVRLHGDMTYLSGWTFAGGMRAEGRIGLAFDAFDTAQDSRFSGTAGDIFPQAALTLRYPLARTGSDGSVQSVEPLLQIGWTGGTQADVANDESTRVEFDEGNLLELSRFPEADRREHGPVLALGLNWARYDARGWESYLSFGQILRETEITDFSRTSGLGGLSSDFLVAGQMRTQDGLALAGRMLFDENFDFSKAELRGDWSNADWTLGGSYVWLVEDLAEERSKAVSEFTLAGRYRVNRHWTVLGNWRYDAEDDRTARAGFGLGYRNECVAVDLNVEQRFTSSTSVEPETTFGFTVALRGFSASGATESFKRSCS